MSEKFCFGNTELIIAYGDGVYHVLHLQDDEYEVVCTGNYEECLEYCERERVVAQNKEFAILSQPTE